MLVLSLEVADADLDAFVAAVDTNRDGKITFNEFWDAFNDSHIDVSKVKWRPRTVLNTKPTWSQVRKYQTGLA